jgi:hypothetical protein
MDGHGGEMRKFTARPVALGRRGMGMKRKKVVQRNRRSDTTTWRVGLDGRFLEQRGVKSGADKT